MASADWLEISSDGISSYLEKYEEPDKAASETESVAKWSQQGSLLMFPRFNPFCLSSSPYIWGPQILSKTQAQLYLSRILSRNVSPGLSSSFMLVSQRL